MKYYNQNNYAHIPYPSQQLPNATVKSGGCGLCCSSNVLSFFGADYPPEVLAPIFIQKGARVNGGTNMFIAANIVSELCGCEFETTSDENKLIECLKDGGIVIANVDGDIGEKGIFSNQGHFINILSYNSDDTLNVFDVAYYKGKFSSAYRSQYVKESTDQYGNPIQICSKEVLDIDTKHRTPNYYLFRKGENTLPTTTIETPEQAIKILQEKGIIDSPEYWQKAQGCVKYLDLLLVKIASYLEENS